MAGPTHFPTRAHVLVCTGPRCTEAGARRLFARAWAEAERRGFAYYKAGGTIRMTEAGCLGACGFGPNAVAYVEGEDGRLDQAWIAGLDDARLMAVLEALHRGEPIPDAGRYG